MAEFLIAWVLAGCVLGIITGIVPGIHVNTIAAFALGATATGRIELVALIASMAIVHTFVDFVPSIMLAIPGEDNFLSVLPGQRFFLKGKGHFAVMLTVWGGIIGGVTSIAISPVFIKFLKTNISAITTAVPWVLITVLGIMIASEKGLKKKAMALTVIALASVLGLVVLSASGNVKNPVLVLVTGFFGAAPILHSLRNRPVARKQNSGSVKVKTGLVLEGGLLSVLGASIVSMFPGIGPNQAALILRTFIGKIKTSSYLVMLGGINTSNMFLSLTALYAVGKTRTGAAAAIKQLIVLDAKHIVLIAGVSLIAIGFGAMAAMLISKQLGKVVGLLEYNKINWGVLVLLVVIVGLLSNVQGIIAFATATAIGFGAISLGLKRSHCMAFLMVPTIVYYLWQIQ